MILVPFIWFELFSVIESLIANYCVFWHHAFFIPIYLFNSDWLCWLCQFQPEEIFDDNDFYQRLLRQLIENKAEDTCTSSSTHK